MNFDVQRAAEFIPQRPPFVFVENLHYADEKKSICSFHIPPNNLFVKNGYFSTAGLVECMAQTAAAGTGYAFRKMNKPVPVGYIGAVQKLKVEDWPAANAEIKIEIELITQIMQVSLVSGTITCDGKQMASCEMKIFVNQRS